MNSYTEPLAPTKVEVELTDGCNLSCQFCYNPARAQPAPLDRILHIFDVLKNSKVLEVVLTGGEPAEHTEFFSILEEAHRRFPRVMVQSNGTRFQGKALERLLQMKPFCVNFSLHGPQAIHDELTRTPGSFSLTCDALAGVVRGGVRVASNLVLTRLNCAPGILEETVSILASLGVKEMTATRFAPIGLGKSKLDLCVPKGDLLRAIEMLQRATRQRGLSFLLANATPMCQLPQSLHCLAERCAFGVDKWYIDAQGSLLTCGMSRVSLGNVLEQPLGEILRTSPRASAIREMRHLPATCLLCAALEQCGGGCRAAALAYSGDFHGIDTLGPSN